MREEIAYRNLYAVPLDWSKPYTEPDPYRDFIHTLHAPGPGPETRRKLEALVIDALRREQWPIAPEMLSGFAAQ